MIRRRAFVAISSLLLAFLGTGIVRAQDFYTQRLEAGKSEFAGERYGDAADDFRIAAFGMLNAPARLSEALARLAVADAAAKRPDDLKAALDRFLEIERRFPSYEKASLEPEIRAKFKELLLAQFPEAVIAGIPSLSGMVPTPEQKILGLPPKEREGALEEKAKAEPDKVIWPLDRARLAAAEGDEKDVVAWAGRALEIAPANEDALALRGHALVSRKDYARGRPDLAALPAGRLDREPDLLSDLFVCDVELSDWAAAADIAPRLAGNPSARTDLDRAQKDFAKHAAEEKKAAEKRDAEEKKQAERAAAEAAKAAAAAPSKTEVVAQPEATASAPPPEAPSAPPVEVAAPPPAAPPASPTTEPPPSAPPPPALPTVADARALVVSGKPQEAEKILLDLAKAQPKRRDVRLGLLEAACLSKDWATGASQVPILEPFRAGEEPSLFYSAVVLWETGETGRARIFALRARERITPSPYTDFYMKKILGEGK